MAIKSTEKKTKNNPSFPCLMKSKNDGTIILATKKTEYYITGTVLVDNRGYGVGYYSEEWNLTSFGFYFGELTVANN